MSAAPATDHLPEVRAQYEALPYPARDAKDDAHRLLRTWLEDLPMLNHYCFAGRQTFRSGFRVLVAGGGTGDATIFLAEQLRGTDARIVHLDLSEASIAIAQARAQARGLGNIEWVRDSLLNLPSRGLEPFDYINCVGVLHHLADPDAGLRALLALRKPEGALGLMVYGAIGRTGVYQMQSLLRMVQDGDAADVPSRIAQARDLLDALPARNWFRRGEADIYIDHKSGDAGLYDLLLHSQDRAYTVDALYDWLETGHGMHIAFTEVQRGRAAYLPHMVLGRKPPAQLQQWRQWPLRRQQACAELLAGDITMHSFYLTREAGRAATYGDVEMVPFFFHEPITGEVMSRVFNTNRGKPFLLQHQHSGITLTVDPGKHSVEILRLIDGRRSFGEIFETVRSGWNRSGPAPSNEVLFQGFAESYDTLNALDRLLLRYPMAGDLPSA